MILNKRFPYPHEVFTTAELAVWRSFWSSNPENTEITMPGPAQWWENYDLDKYGFVGALDSKKAEQALVLMAKKYNFSSSAFQIPAEALSLEESLVNLVLL